jgi:hypothetical protein
MNKNYLIILTILFVTLNGELALANFPKPKSNYSNYEILKDDQVQFWWDSNIDTIMFEVHVKNPEPNGFAAFGVSKDGEMENADVVVFMANSEKVSFTDRNIDSFGMVAVDKKQDWKASILVREGDFLISNFSRKIKTGDAEDRDIIVNNPNWIIFSFGNTDSNGAITYHGPVNRGQKAVLLIQRSGDLDGGNTGSNSGEMSIWDIIIQFFSSIINSIFGSW